jgi:hypothetical protein
VRATLYHTKNNAELSLIYFYACIIAISLHTTLLTFFPGASFVFSFLLFHSFRAPLAVERKMKEKSIFSIGVSGWKSFGVCFVEIIPSSASGERGRE